MQLKLAYSFCQVISKYIIFLFFFFTENNFSLIEFFVALREVWETVSDSEILFFCHSRGWSSLTTSSRSVTFISVLYFYTHLVLVLVLLVSIPVPLKVA